MWCTVLIDTSTWRRNESISIRTDSVSDLKCNQIWAAWTSILSTNSYFVMSTETETALFVCWTWVWPSTGCEESGTFQVLASWEKWIFNHCGHHHCLPGGLSNYLELFFPLNMCVFVRSMSCGDCSRPCLCDVTAGWDSLMETSEGCWAKPKCRGGWKVSDNIRFQWVV